MKDKFVRYIEGEPEYSAILLFEIFDGVFLLESHVFEKDAVTRKSMLLKKETLYKIGELIHEIKMSDTLHKILIKGNENDKHPKIKKR